MPRPWGAATFSVTSKGVLVSQRGHAAVVMTTALYYTTEPLARLADGSPIHSIISSARKSNREIVRPTASRLTTNSKRADSFTGTTSTLYTRRRRRPGRDG